MNIPESPCFLYPLLPALASIPSAHHPLPAALLPVVSYAGPAAAAVLAGSLVVETLFSLPGMGRHLVQGALNRDYTLVMGMVIVYAALMILLNLVADIACAWLDPRIRSERRR